MESRLRNTLLGSIGLSAGTSLVIILLLGLTVPVLGYIIVLSIIIIVFPSSVILYLRSAEMKKMEDQFPNWLRDMAQSKKAGMTLSQALSTTSKTDYGPLSKEIKIMNNHLSWGIPFPDTIKMFSKRIQSSSYIRRGLSILMESYYAGGKIADSMEAVAESTRILKEVERSRESVLQEQLMIIYVIHFIFVGIIVGLYKILIPLLTMQTAGSFGSIFAFATGNIPTGAPAEPQTMTVTGLPSIEYYKLLFFITISIQSFCNGIVAGETKEGRAVAGMKHVAVMLTAGLVAFVIFIFPQTFEVSVASSHERVFAGDPVEVIGTVQLEGSPVNNATVSARIGQSVSQGITDESGEYELEVFTPLERGEYEIIVTASYRSFNARGSTKIDVR